MIGRPFTHKMLDKCPRHDHGCGLPHVDGKCARDALVNTAMGLSEFSGGTERAAIGRIHNLLSAMYHMPEERKHDAWLEIVGLALRQATKEPEKPVPLFPVGNIEP